MKKILMTLAASCFFTAAVYAQTDSLNRQQTNQYKNQQPTGQPSVPAQNGTTPKAPTSGSPEIENQVNPRPQNNVPLQNGSQGTSSGSTPYDTTGTNRGSINTGIQSGAGKTNAGTTSGTSGSGTYGTGTNGTGSGTTGASSPYGTKSTTGRDSTLRQPNN